MFLAAAQKFGVGLITSGLARCELGTGVAFGSLLVTSALNSFIHSDLLRMVTLGYNFNKYE